MTTNKYKWNDGGGNSFIDAKTRGRKFDEGQDIYIPKYLSISDLIVSGGTSSTPPSPGRQAYITDIGTN